MKFIYGSIRPDIPPEYIPPEMWPEYGFIADMPPVCHREIVSDNPVAVRWGVWPLYFEQYIGNAQPDIAVTNKHGNLRYTRFVGWRRLTDGPIPRGWRRALPLPYRVDGYQTLKDNEDFTVRWHKNARRDLRLWQEKHEGLSHAIEEVSWDEYAAAYKESLIAKREGIERLEDLERKIQFPMVKNNTVLYAVRRITDKTIVAGSAVIYSPTHRGSTHFAPFIHTEGRTVFAATALIFHWFNESLKKDCPTVMTINFWHARKPKSWKGFSEFKSHFGWDFVTYPPLLWRIVPGKLW